MRFIPAVSPVQIQVPLPCSTGCESIPCLIWPVGQVVKTRPFHGCNMGSSPVRVTTSAIRKRDCRINGGLAQLVRAPASHAGGHWFESSSLHQTAPDFVRNQVLFSFMPYRRRRISSRCVHHAKWMHAAALRRRKKLACDMSVFVAKCERRIFTYFAQGGYRGLIHQEADHDHLSGNACRNALRQDHRVRPGQTCGGSPNTFYYHYQDIYALLDDWFQKQVDALVPAGEPIEWKPVTKNILRECRAHSKTIYHVFDSLSRDRLGTLFENFLHSAVQDAE